MANNIFILNGQDRSPITHINKKHVLNNNHSQSLETGEHTFTMTVMGDFSFAEHLSRRNILVIPGEDGEFLEFRIIEGVKYRDDSSVFVDVWSTATFLDLKKKKVFDPVRTEPFTAEQHAMAALANTGWQVGNVDFSGSRTLTFEKPFNSYDYLKRISSEFELEMRFYVTTDEGGITGHYVDLVNRIGEFRGRIARFGKDLTSIRRIENTENIVTALWAYGPEREDNTRLKTLITDEDALQRWGERGKNGELTHIIDIYEPQSNDQDMTLEELKRYGRTELNKRINAAISFEANIVDLEHVPGLENKIIRFGDTIMTKDESFQPPLYVEARIYKQDRDVFVKDSKKVELGDFTEYTEEEVNAIWQSLQNEIRNRLSKLLVTTVVSSTGNTFKNGVGSTELSATVFLTGNETDKDGTIYNYKWSKRDKDGNLTSFEANGKTITVNAEDIDQKATYIVDVMQDGHTLSLGMITISNVFDGQDGERGPQGIQGPKGDDGKTLYVWRKYADDAQGNGMSDSPVGKAYMGLAYNKESPIQSNNPDDYEWSKYKGEQGVEGPKGDDGQTTYTWVKFADDKEGNGMSEEPDDKRYLGMAFNKTTPNESSNPSDYNWSPLYDNVQVGGRNLLRETQKEVKVISSSGWGDVSHPNGHDLLEKGVLQKGETYTFRVYLETDSYPVRCYIRIPSSSIPYRDFRGNNVPANSKGYSTVTFTVPDDAINATAFVVRFNQTDTPIQQVGYGEEKIEKGNIATDWTPAPEDERAYAEYISQLKADLAEEEAKAHADGKVTAEEQARIDQAKRNLEEAKNHANTKSEEAKEGAKTDVESGTVNLPGGSIVDTISGDHLDIDLSVFGATPQYMSIYAYNQGVWTIQSIAAGSTPSNWHTFDFFKFRPTKQYLTVDGRGKIETITGTGSGRVYGWLVVELYNSTGLSSDTRLSLNTLTTASRDFMITVDISGHDNAYLRFKFDKTGGEEDGYGGIRVRQIYMHN